MSTLEHHYRRLLWTYPTAWRQSRGDEIVATLLEAAPPEQRRPSLGEVSDLTLAGIRRRLQNLGNRGLDRGLYRTGQVGLLAAVTLAVLWLVYDELAIHAIYNNSLAPLTVGVWGAWILAGLSRALLPHGLSRPLLYAALVITSTATPLAAVTDWQRPPLYLLATQIAFGAFALALRRAPHWVERILVLALPAAALLADPDIWTQPLESVVPLPHGDVLEAVALAALGAALLLAVAWRGSGWLWAALLLVPPATVALTKDLLHDLEADPATSFVSLLLAAVAALTCASLAIAVPLWIASERRERHQPSD
jgi:hypothetical protein